MDAAARTSVHALIDAWKELLDGDDPGTRRFRELAIHAVPNFWDIVYPESPSEIRYSRTLRWLFDPSAGHGLGAWFTNAFLKEVFPGEGLHVSTSADARVEWHDADIVITDLETRVGLVIENKTTDGGEHPHGSLSVSQLDWVYWVLTHDERNQRQALDTSAASRKKAKTYKRPDPHIWPADESMRVRAVFLTPTGEAPSASALTANEWHPVAYSVIIDLLARADERTADEDASKIIRDLHSSMIRRADRESRPHVAKLFFAESAAPDATAPVRLNTRTARFAPLLTALADHRQLIEPNPGQYYAGLRSGDLHASAHELWAELLTAAREQGLTPDEVSALLAFTWEQRPRDTQNQKKNAEMIEIISLIAGRLDVEPGDVIMSAEAVSMGMRIVARDGAKYWFAGSNSCVIPTVFEFDAVPDVSKKRSVRGRGFRYKKLKDWREALGADEAVANHIAQQIRVVIAQDVASRATAASTPATT